MDGGESYFICPSSFMDRYTHTHPAPTHASADTYISASTKPAGRINKNNSAAAPYRFDGLNIFFTFYLLPMMLVRTLYVMPCEYAGHHWLCKMGGCSVFYDTTYRARMIYGYCNFCCRIFPSISSGRSPPASSPTGASMISARSHRSLNRMDPGSSIRFISVLTCTFCFAAILSSGTLLSSMCRLIPALALDA